MIALAGLVVACSANQAKEEKICTPEAFVFCRCQDRAEGTKKCKDDGMSFDECLPCDGSGDKGEGAGGTDGLGSGHGTDAAERTEASETKPEEKPTADAGSGSTLPQEGRPTQPKRDAGTTTSGPKPDTTNVPNAPHCKLLKNVAPRIELQKLADEPTTAVGGKVLPGLYVQSWAIEFTGDGGEAGPSKHYSRETLELFEDNVGRFVFEDDDGTKASGGFRLTDDGKTKFNVAYECPAAPPKELAYDATEQTLIIYDPPYARVFYRQMGADK